MSWLSGLAEGAETFLNKMDQTAGEVLQNQSVDSALASQQAEKLSQTSIASQSFDYGRLSKIPPSSSVPSNLSKYSSFKSNINGKLSKEKADKDAELFEFLNSNNTESTDKRKRPNSLHSRHSSQSSTASSRVRAPAAETAATDPVLDIKSADETIIDRLSDSPVEESVRTSLSEGTEASSGYGSAISDGAKYNQLEIENNMLKNEMAVLNNEFTDLVKSRNESHQELQNLQRMYKKQAEQLSNAEQISRELQARDSDIAEALQAKDSQLAVLRVRFEETDAILRDKMNILSQLEVAKDRILADHTSASDVHNSALDNLTERLSATEEMLVETRKELSQTQKDIMQERCQMENEKKSMAHSLSLSQKSLDDKDKKLLEVNRQVQILKTKTDNAKQELDEYKEKASRILQSKERLISDLKAGTTLTMGEDIGVSLSEFETIKQEKEMLQSELTKSRVETENLRQDLQDLEMQLQAEIQRMQEQQDALSESLDSEKVSRGEVELENEKKCQELKYVHEELVKQKTTYTSRLQDRDNEVDKLRQQLTYKAVNSTSESELENRLHQLTENLIHKQTVVEALSTEKNSLVHQLERMEKQYSESQLNLSRANSSSVRMQDDDEVRSRMPHFMREKASDGEISRKVKRAANSIDKFSVRLGVFLRRYPMARIFVILYMLLLHLWVFVVLLTYQPEVHLNGVMPAPPPKQ